MILNRRSAMGLLASAVAVRPAQAVAPPLMPIRDTRLHVEVIGPPNAPTLFYFHGGPGAGSYDFSFVQGARLAKHLRVVMIDQRGVLRSEALRDNQSCTLNDLIEDAEAVRVALGIRRWSVLGHSFGAHFALMYATRYPNAVDKLLFEGPTIDFRSTSSHTLHMAAQEFMRLKDPTNAMAALEASVNQPADDQAMLNQFDIVFRLGDKRNNLYVRGPEKNIVERIQNESGVPKEVRRKVLTHQNKLFAEGAILKPRFEEMRAWRKPALLMRGLYDPATAPVQVGHIMAGKSRRLVQFENSGHFCRIEEPDLYARTVTDFVLS